MTLRLAVAVLAATSSSLAAGRPPIIDMHVHAYGAGEYGPPPLARCSPYQGFDAWDQRRSLSDIWRQLSRNPPCADPVWSPKTDDEVRSRTVAVMDKLNIIGAVSGSPERVEAWRRTRPERFFPALQFNLEPEYTVDRLRQLHGSGRLAVFGEIATQYSGIAPDDPRMEPFWAMAEELDVPVAIHVGLGPSGAAYRNAPGYRARLDSALTLEEVLIKHPRLRIYVMHAGWPMGDDMIAILHSHPQVHVDVGFIVWSLRRAEFYRYLLRMVDAGFESRILFGSDQMVWPETIERAVRVIEDAPFLSAAQKRAILYDNAARFLRLSKEQIVRHHSM